MLTRPIVRLVRAPYALRVASGARFYNPDQKGDTHDQAHQQGLAARDPRKAAPVDAASPQTGKNAARGGLSGNQENIGFAEQVGSQSTSGSNIYGNKLGKPESAEGVSGKENITPPSFADTIKQKLGVNLTAAEAKQNRGGGKGVTGTGQVTLDRGKREMHTSAVSRMAAVTRGQAPQASRQPKEKTHGDQNPHLKHKSNPSQPDQGKGNAAAEPSLPSQHFQSDASWQQRPSSSSKQQQRREFSTSSCARAETDALETEHTAESYFKEVGDTKPTNPKVHQVDGSANGAPVMRANEGPVSGEFSRSGSQTKEYETASKQEQPYNTPPTKGLKAEHQTRYGGTPGLNKPSGPEEGPTGESAGGRKPEGQ